MFDWSNHRVHCRSNQFHDPIIHRMKSSHPITYIHFQWLDMNWWYDIIYLYKLIINIMSYKCCWLLLIISFEAGRGAGAQSVTVKSTGCGFYPHSRKWNIYLHLYFHFFALVSSQSAGPVLGGKWGTECLNTRFPLPTMLWDAVWSWL